MLPNIEVQENHNITAFKEGGKMQTITLNAGECKTIEYTLTPMEKGKTSIFFNIKALGFSESFEQKVEVE